MAGWFCKHSPDAPETNDSFSPLMRSFFLHGDRLSTFWRKWTRTVMDGSRRRRFWKIKRRFWTAKWQTTADSCIYRTMNFSQTLCSFMRCTLFFFTMCNVEIILRFISSSCTLMSSEKTVPTCFHERFVTSDVISKQQKPWKGQVKLLSSNSHWIIEASGVIVATPANM